MGNKRGRKTTVAERQQLRVKFYKYILYDRLTFNQFRDKVSVELGCTTRQASSYYLETKQEIKDKFDQEAESILSSQLERYYNLLNRCIESGNRRVEREVLAQMDKLYGLESVKKIDVTSGGNPIQLNINLLDD